MQTGLGLVVADGPYRACGGDETHRARGALNGSPFGLAEVGYGEHGEILFRGEFRQRLKDTANDRVKV